MFDEKEMCALTDATLDFWLTTGRFADEFEKEFAKWIGVKFANLVNSGSSANLIAFMALTAPELGDRQIKKFLTIYDHLLCVLLLVGFEGVGCSQFSGDTGCQLEARREAHQLGFNQQCVLCVQQPQ